MMLAGMLFYIIKFVCYGYVSSVNGVLIVTSLQCITYPFITLSSRILFAEIANHNKNLKTSTQLIAASIYLGVSALLTPVLCGYLVMQIGHDMTLYVLAGFLLIVLMIAYTNRKLIQVNDYKTNKKT